MTDDDRRAFEERMERTIRGFFKRMFEVSWRMFLVEVRRESRWLLPRRTA